MTKLNKNQRQIIVDHFDEIINQIDIKTDTLLQEHSLKEETRNKLNEIRGKQIEKIKEIKEINLKLLQNEEELELDLEKLIHFDCVLLEQTENNLNGFVLWITSWFHNQNDVEFLRYINLRLNGILRCQTPKRKSFLSYNFGFDKNGDMRLLSFHGFFALYFPVVNYFSRLAR